MWYPEYYVIGYDPSNLIKVTYKFDRITEADSEIVVDKVSYNYFDTVNISKIIDNPDPSIVADATSTFSIFYSLESAKRCIENIKARKGKVWMDNLSIIDSIVEEKNRYDTYNPDNLKIYRLPVMDLEEVDEATP